MFMVLAENTINLIISLHVYSAIISTKTKHSTPWNLLVSIDPENSSASSMDGDKEKDG